MSDKPVPSSLQEGLSSLKSWRACWMRCVSPFTFCIVLAITMASFFVYFRSSYASLWQSYASQTDDIATLKSLAMTLGDRLNRLESSEKAVPLSFNSEQFHELEGRITALQQQIKALQSQPKVEEPAGQLERYQAFEKDLKHLSQAQEIMKTTLTFWRLKEKVLSDAPYARELAAYKAAMKRDEDLALLEQYANQGLQALKASPEESYPISLADETSSWWSRLKRAACSLIKIEKVGASISQSPSFLQDRQAIEDLLTRLDQTLAQQLNTLSPLSGDAL